MIFLLSATAFAGEMLPDHRNLKDHLAVKIRSEGVMQVIRQTLNSSKASDEFNFESPKKIISGQMGNPKISESTAALLSALLGIELAEKTAYNLGFNSIKFSGKIAEKVLSLNAGPVRMKFATKKKPVAVIFLETDSMASELKLDVQDISFSTPSEKLYVDVGFAIEKLKISIPKMFICELGSCVNRKDDRIALSDVVLQTASNSEKITVSARIAVDQSTGKVIVESIKTNIADNDVRIEMPAFGIELPKVTLSFGDKELVLSDAVFKRQILAQRKVIIEKFVSGVSELVTGKVADELNGLLSTFKSPMAVYGGALQNEDYEFADGTQAASPIKLEAKARQLRKSSETLGAAKFFESLLYSCSYDLGFGEFDASDAGSLVIGGRGSLRVRSLGLVPSYKVGPGFPKQALQKANFNTIAAKKAHASIAIAEPLLNSILSVFSRTALLNDIIREQSENDGIGLRKTGVKIHFKNVSGKPHMYIVVNLRIDIMKVSNWFIGALGTLSEYVTGGNNLILFPLEFEYVPEVVDKKLRIRLVRNPYANEVLHNSFGYTMQLPSSLWVDYQFRKQLSENLIDLAKDSTVEAAGILKFGNTELQPIAVEYDEAAGQFMVHGNFIEAQK